MAELEYSIDALNAKSAFYRAKAMVYVEGDDDVLFWHEVLSHTSSLTLEIESVGGTPELEKYVARVSAGELDAIVARDSDLRPLTGSLELSPRMLYTLGHSIENSIYTLDAIHHLAKSWCKSYKVAIEDCRVWLLDLAEAYSSLLQLDLANQIAGAGTPTIGDNCSRFMASQASCKPSKAKVVAYKLEVEKRLPPEALLSAAGTVGADPERVLLFLRGHFLASAVMKFLVSTAKSYGKRAAISVESLYAAAIAYFGAAFGPKHPHFNHYAASARLAVDSL
jgi:hypothetical protein